VLADAPIDPDGDQAIAAPPTEDEWVQRFVAEFDAEEIIPDPDAEPGPDPGPTTESEA
jgi:hypothetical protein